MRTRLCVRLPGTRLNCMRQSGNANRVNKKLLKKRLKLVTLSSFNRRGRLRCKPFLHSVVYFHLMLPPIDTPVCQARLLKACGI